MRRYASLIASVVGAPTAAFTFPFLTWRRRGIDVHSSYFIFHLRCDLYVTNGRGRVWAANRTACRGDEWLSRGPRTGAKRGRYRE